MFPQNQASNLLTVAMSYLRQHYLQDILKLNTFFKTQKRKIFWNIALDMRQLGSTYPETNNFKCATALSVTHHCNS